MKVKTSVTLSAETLREVDRLAGRRFSRSRVIEQAVREFIARRARARREARDLELLNSAADDLNREMEDVLGYQAEL